MRLILTNNRSNFPMNFGKLLRPTWLKNFKNGMNKKFVSEMKPTAPSICYTSKFQNYQAVL